MIRIQFIVSSLAVFFGLAFASIGFGQAYKEDVGFNALLNYNGGVAPADGSGLTVAMPEAPDGSGRYMGSVSGKTINNGTGTNTGISSHASTVGRNFFDNSVSLAPGITDITGYEAGDYINRVLNLAGGDPLTTETYDITNHSYIGFAGSTAEKNQVLSRLDFVVNRDNMLSVVGTNNSSSNTTPDYLATSYNSIVVGLSNGNHARGQTSDYGAGRFKPDIVAPSNATSFSTPFVSAGAALLRSAGVGTNAEQNEVTKALLFAGATKHEFSDWDRTSTRPVDEVFGFGEMNVFNSYLMLEAGEFEASTSEPTQLVGDRGYDFDNYSGTGDLFYDVDLIEDGDISAALVWNAIVNDGDASTAVFDPTVTVANLDLELYDSSGSFLGSLIDSSVSTDYNYEHIFIENLSAGRYTFRITGDSATDFAFAWTAVPEPTGGLLVGLLALAAFGRRRRV
ncbi:MAG: S8 family serine peptidase [Planctomycetota bacterium]